MTPFVLLQRLTKEARITSDAIREAVIAISERVNRRVQIMRLHWQATGLHQQIQSVHRRLGSGLCEALAPADHLLKDALLRSPELVEKIQSAAAAIGLLNRELDEIQTEIRTLELEALREDFLKLQQDLLKRGMSMRRALVGSTAPVLGRRITDIPLVPGVALAAVFRGAMMLVPSPQITVHAHDIMILFGPDSALDATMVLFGARQAAFDRVV